jgi:hypothetical protein
MQSITNWHGPSVKRIVNGKTYNTETASLIARYEADHYNQRMNRRSEIETWIYRTEAGAFFQVLDETIIDLMAESMPPISRIAVQPLSRTELDRLIANSGFDIEIIDETLLPPPPEAGAEDDEAATATMYLRLPPSLKARCEAAARKGQQSANLWARQALEERLSRD